MNIWVKIGLILIVLHLVLGFGWLMYKLSPRKKDKKKDEKG
jgi:lipopolysaccharide biosynthesis regulator YciM